MPRFCRFALAMFGYITATIASSFLGETSITDSRHEEWSLTPDDSALHEELAAIRRDLASLGTRLPLQELPHGVVRETRAQAADPPPSHGHGSARAADRSVKEAAGLQSRPESRP